LHFLFDFQGTFCVHVMLYGLKSASKRTEIPKRLKSNFFFIQLLIQHLKI